MALSRLQQIVLAEEATEGTATALASLFAAANAKHLVIDPSLDYTVNVYNRNVKQDSLTPLQSLTGTKTGTARFSVELSGDTGATSVPSWGTPLRACGFRQEKLTKITLPTTVGTITGGPFYHGQTVNQVSSGAFGMVVGTTYDTEPTLWVAQENHLGHNPGQSITAFTTGGVISVSGGASTSVNPSAVSGTVSSASYTAPAGVAWFPWSVALASVRTNASGVINTITAGGVFYGQTSGAIGQFYQNMSTGTASATRIYYRKISGTFQVGEVIASQLSGGTTYATLNLGSSQFQIPTLSVGMAKDGVQEAISGSRGSVTFSGRIGEPLIMTFELQGSYHSFQDAGNVSGVTHTSQVPPVLLDADLRQGKSGTSYASEYGPCISQFDINMGSTISFKDCMASAAGVEYANLTDRQPTITIDPDLIVEGAWDYLKQFTNNTPSRASFSIGSANQNRFWIKMPGLSYTAVTTGDRNGLATRQLTANLHGGSQTVGATDSDNEMVLIYGIL